MWIWTIVENDLLIICSSLPTLRCLFRKCFPVSTLSYTDPNHFRLARFGGTLEDGDVHRSRPNYDNSQRPWESTDSLRSAQSHSLESPNIAFKTMMDRRDPPAQPIATMKEILSK
jgi:hypothetical protein